MACGDCPLWRALPYQGEVSWRVEMGLCGWEPEGGWPSSLKIAGELSIYRRPMARTEGNMCQCNTAVYPLASKGREGPYE